MDERIENPELKEIMKTAPENMSEEQLESFVDSFIEATFIIPAELNSDSEALEGKTDEEIALDEDIDLEIMKLEDEDGEVLFPIYTDDDELEKLAAEEDFDIYGLVISAEDLATLLYETEEDEFDGVVINPFHENAVELPLEAIFELYDFEECDDPDCDDPTHNH
ncbi:MAG: SseB family protein [Methanobrevibacter sp.]|nr:SseB family protein [Methanobrevibacter sp.]